MALAAWMPVWRVSFSRITIPSRLFLFQPAPVGQPLVIGVAIDRQAELQPALELGDRLAADTESMWVGQGGEALEGEGGGETVGRAPADGAAEQAVAQVERAPVGLRIPLASENRSPLSRITKGSQSGALASSVMTMGAASNTPWMKVARRSFG